MEEQKFSFGGSFKKAKEYIDSQLELFKLKAVAKGSRIVGSVVLGVTKILFLLLVLFFWSMALGFYLSYLLGSYALGFLATGGIFLLIIILINAFNKKLSLTIMNVVIGKLLAKWHEEEVLPEDRVNAEKQQRKKDEEFAKVRETQETLKNVEKIVKDSNEHK